MLWDLLKNDKSVVFKIGLLNEWNKIIKQGTY